MEQIDNERWIGVDLDGTLAYHAPGADVDHVGPPIPLMLQRVKEWLAMGQRVRVLTARVSRPGAGSDHQREMITAWLLEHVGVELPVTCVKDWQMLELWDDRAITVERNTGRVLVRR